MKTAKKSQEHSCWAHESPSGYTEVMLKLPSFRKDPKVCNSGGLAVIGQGADSAAIVNVAINFAA